jgi:hypothetical protein
MAIIIFAIEQKTTKGIKETMPAVILEDNPYGDLRFAGEDIKSIKTLDTDGSVIYDGDMAGEAKEAVKGLSGGYKRMEGFFVTPKVLTFSGFMS